MNKITTIAIVGGGASGVLVAARLLGSSAGRSGKIRIVLIERGPHLGRGVAFGTLFPHHLLNVPKGRISAYAEDSEHFSKWISRNFPDDSRRDYLPRHYYAAYLNSILETLISDAPPGSFQFLRGEARSFEERGSRLFVLLSSRSEISCDRLVLATGLRAPRLPEGFRSIKPSPRLIEDPWDTHATSVIENSDSILVIGSGLTTVDFISSRIRVGHLAPIEVLSRHGYSPQSHLESTREWALPKSFPDGTARSVLRFLREETSRTGVVWPDVVDRFRLEIHRIWSLWSESERRRFLRHAQSAWDIHRHRVSPEVFREWELWRKSGQVRITAGRVLAAVEEGKEIRVEIRKRGGEVISAGYARVVNCTGARPEMSLLEGHAYQTDPLGIGWPTDPEGRPIRTDGNPDVRVFVIGAALRTLYWEMTAIPDLRVHAKRLADALLTSIS